MILLMTCVSMADFEEVEERMQVVVEVEVEVDMEVLLQEMIHAEEDEPEVEAIMDEQTKVIRGDLII